MLPAQTGTAGLPPASRCIEPLHVIDRDDQGHVPRQQPEHVQYSQRDRPLIERRGGRLHEQERDLERPPPRPDERRATFGTNYPSGPSAPKGERRLTLGTSNESTRAPRPSTLHARFPQCRFPNPRLARENQRGRPSLDAL